MRYNIKYIIISIISTLCLVFIAQLFWLSGLYRSIEAEIEKSIIECLSIANSDELEYRLDSIENTKTEDSYKGEITISNINSGYIKDSSKDSNKLMKRKKVLQKGDTIENTVEEIGDDQFTLAQFESLGVLIRETIHQAIDSISPIRLDILKTSLNDAFKDKNIHSDIYKIEIVDFEKNITLSSLKETEQKGVSFSYIYDTNKMLGYKIYIEPIAKTILMQMLGILISTFLLVIILAFSFWYLIHIIFHQKTLEEMKDDLINNMTHELKTPIAVAYSATDALLNFKQAENKELLKKYLTINKEQLEKLSGLLEQILSISTERQSKLILKKESFMLKEILEPIVDEYLFSTNKEITINLNIQPDNLMIVADKNHLYNAFSNIIDNAIKYSENKSIIDIYATESNKVSTIKIKDNGIGIPAEKIKFLFDRFYRVPQGNKHDIKGYGIGLFYVKTIIEKHEGTIDVESTLEKGSQFTIKIPRT